MSLQFSPCPGKAGSKPVSTFLLPAGKCRRLKNPFPASLVASSLFSVSLCSTGIQEAPHDMSGPHCWQNAVCLLRPNAQHISQSSPCSTCHMYGIHDFYIDRPSLCTFMVQPQSREPITNPYAPSDYTNYFTYVSQKPQQKPPPLVFPAV